MLITNNPIKEKIANACAQARESCDSFMKKYKVQISKDSRNLLNEIYSVAKKAQGNDDIIDNSRHLDATMAKGVTNNLIKLQSQLKTDSRRIRRELAINKARMEKKNKLGWLLLEQSNSLVGFPESYSKKVEYKERHISNKTLEMEIEGHAV